jgi:glycosyltransferase involved in cell wall biosynthesis
MRIGFVVSFLELTGGHIATLEIANRLAAHGHELLLVYPARSIMSRRNDSLRRLGGVVPDALLSPLYHSNTDRLDWASFEGEIVRIRELEDRFMPDLDAVVATAWQTAERVAPMGSQVGRKAYFIQHYETWSGAEARVDATWRAPFLRIASSEWLRQLAVERFGIDDVHVVPYGVDLEAFFPDPPAERSAKLRVGVLTHDEPWKGVADSVTAIRAAIDGGRDVQPVFFGLFAPPDGLPEGTEVTLRPGRHTLRRLYSSLDIFLCGSWAESGPMTVPEAMACGTCIVSTDVGNVSLWCGGTDAAYLAAPRSPIELSAALAAALDDPATRAEKAERGLERIQAYTWERAAAEFARLLEEAS